jgi:hypothetical protein
MILFCLGCLVSRNLAVQSVNYPFSLVLMSLMNRVVIE